MLAVQALQAFFHVSPFALDGEGQPLASDAQLDLAQVGGLLVNELIADSRAVVEHPMTIQFLSGGPKVVPYKREPSEGTTLPADRTGIPEGSKDSAG
jgi:hypothetical protein